MFSNPIIRQDLKINKSRILVMFLLQMTSLLMAIGICEMNLIEISDIFWDTIPVIVIPMLTEMLLAYETITKCKEEGTMDLILSTGLKTDRILRSKIAVIYGTGIGLILVSAVLGCLTRVYRLTGEWNQKEYILLNLGACCLQVLLAGFSYWMAARSRNLKSYIRTAVLIPMILYAIYLAYYWTDQLFFLRYVTIFSLYCQEWFAEESILALVGSGILLVAGLFCFFLGNRAFYDMNLPE